MNGLGSSINIQKKVFSYDQNYVSHAIIQKILKCVRTARRKFEKPELSLKSKSFPLREVFCDKIFFSIAQK